MIIALAQLSIMVAPPILSLVIKCCHSVPAALGSHYPRCIREPSLEVTLPTVLFDPQSRVITELPKDAETPLTNLLDTVMVKGESS